MEFAYFTLCSRSTEEHPINFQFAHRRAMAPLSPFCREYTDFHPKKPASVVLPLTFIRPCGTQASGHSYQ